MAVKVKHKISTGHCAYKFPDIAKSKAWSGLS